MIKNHYSHRKGRILKKGAFLALKGRYITAQGNALGKKNYNDLSPERATHKMNNNSRYPFYVAPLQGLKFFFLFTQGVARRCPALPIAVKLRQNQLNWARRAKAHSRQAKANSQELSFPRSSVGMHTATLQRRVNTK
ncbi:hypothetical protein MHK_001122 [Candidatus Magnetomorum sp. HK-1]|nr:hypothetical protein MHK_001122 [Candidatus Magnetomorum sp. HK-1]